MPFVITHNALLHNVLYNVAAKTSKTPLDPTAFSALYCTLLLVPLINDHNSLYSVSEFVIQVLGYRVNRASKKSKIKALNSVITIFYLIRRSSTYNEHTIA